MRLIARWFSKIVMFGWSATAASRARSISRPVMSLRVENAALGMAAFLAEVQLARAVGAGNLALGEVHAQLDQLRNPRRAFLDDRADSRFLAQARAGLQRVAHVQLEGVLLAGDGGDAALGVVGVRLGAVLLGDDRHAPVRGDFQRKGKPRSAAAQDKEIKLLHLTFR